MAKPFKGLRATESSEVVLQVMSVIGGSEIEILNPRADRNWPHTTTSRAAPTAEPLLDAMVLCSS